MHPRALNERMDAAEQRIGAAARKLAKHADVDPEPFLQTRWNADAQIVRLEEREAIANLLDTLAEKFADVSGAAEAAVAVAEAKDQDVAEKPAKAAPKATKLQDRQR